MWTPIPRVKVISQPIALDAEGQNTDADLSLLGGGVPLSERTKKKEE